MMIKMTKKDALAIAINCLTDYAANDEVKENRYLTLQTEKALDTLNKMMEQASKPHSATDEQKAARKEKTAQARAALVATVAPVLRQVITENPGLTAKEIYEYAKDNLPADFTAPKVQNVLLREMKPELSITETKNKANTYSMLA